MATLPRLKDQEIPFHHPESKHYFRPGVDHPFVATPAAIELYTQETIIACLHLLQAKASDVRGLDYLQVFEDDSKPEELWVIEEGPGGAITALLPSDH